MVLSRGMCKTAIGASVDNVFGSLRTFPDGFAGIALLLLRGALALMVLVLQKDSGGPGTQSAGAAVVAVPVGCLCAGLLTAWAAGICGLGSIVSVLAGSGVRPEFVLISLSISVAVSVLGPGAYSVDSLLHGRRRRIFPPGT